MSQTERLFLALWPTVDAQQDWAAMARNWLPTGCGRLIPARNLHITLLFLGELDTEQRSKLVQQLDTVRSHCFTLNLDCADYWRKPQVAWLGCSHVPSPLLMLVDQLKRMAEGVGIATEKRAYHPHLTLARKVRRAPPKFQPELTQWQINEFVLVKSELKSSGAEYVPLRRWPLDT